MDMIQLLLDAIIVDLEDDEIGTIAGFEILDGKLTIVMDEYEEDVDPDGGDGEESKPTIFTERKLKLIYGDKDGPPSEEKVENQKEIAQKI